MVSAAINAVGVRTVILIGVIKRKVTCVSEEHGADENWTLRTGKLLAPIAHPTPDSAARFSKAI
jgi:hypothetical protein